MTMRPAAGFAGLLLAVCLPALADAPLNDGSAPSMHRLLDDRHIFSAGIVDQKVDAKIQATADGLDPVGIELEDLGVDDKDTSYYIDYRYRFKPRWMVVAGVYSFNGSGGRAVQRTFNYDGVEYEAGAAIRADFDIDAYLVDVMYAVYRSERAELSLGGGLHALDLGASIAAELSLGDEGVGRSSSGATLLAPVPNLRMGGMWAVTDRLALHFVGGWLSANIDEYSGDFIYGHLRAMYSITERFGVALGYQRTDVDVAQDRARGELSFDTRLDGPTLTFTYSF